MKVEEVVDAPVVDEPEAAHLGTLRAELVRALRVRARLDEGVGRHAEHPDLLVHVAELRDLEALDFALEAHESPGPELTVRRVERVAAAAEANRVAQPVRVREDVPSRLRIAVA